MRSRLFIFAGYTFVFILLCAQPMSVSAQDRTGCYKALGDLRAARWLIATQDSGQITEDETNAMHAIELTVSEIIASDVDDGKYYKDRPDVVNIDMVNKASRLNRAGQLLLNAQTDITNDQDRSVMALKSKMLGHIRDALRLVEKTLATK